MYALVKNNTIYQYPYSLVAAAEDFPNVTFGSSPSDETLNQFGIVRVYFSEQPAHSLFQQLQESTPEFSQTNQRWEQTWLVTDMPPEQALAFKQSIFDDISTQVQKRLDDFVKTRGYTSILTACSYVDSTVAEFKNEAVFCIQLRDTTWQTVYQIFAEMEAGTRPFSVGLTDIESDLPIMQWPN